MTRHPDSFQAMLAAFLVACCVNTSLAEQVWLIENGEITLEPRHDRLKDLAIGIEGHKAHPHQHDNLHGHDHADTLTTYQLEYSANAIFAADDSGNAGLTGRVLRLSDGVIITTPWGDHVVVDLVIAERDRHHNFNRGDEPDLKIAALQIGAIKAFVDQATGALNLYAADVVITNELAAAMGMPSLRGQSIATLHIDAGALWIGGDEPQIIEQQEAPADNLVEVPAGDSNVAAAGSGPDMVFCQLYGLQQFGRLGSFVGMALATTSWNVGTEPLVWYQNPDNRHPFIVGNVFRLKDDRFEQIGQSWIKHGFCALDSSQCTTTCQGTGCTTLGLGCTDTYGASLNANRNYLGPRHEVDPWTGDFTYAGSHLDSSHSHNAIDHRLQMHDFDLDPATNPGASYFGEGYYVCLDDINVMNSIAHKPVTFSGSPGGTWNVGMSGSTTSPIDGPAIYSWPDAQFTTIAQEVPVQEFVSPDGRCVLGWKVTDLGNNMWHYEYALYNVDMDRKVNSFSIPVTDGTIVTNVDFSWVFHHGEPYGNTEWSWNLGGGAITWSTTDNPVRWGTLYNFRFDANVPPVTAVATLGLFEPGTPGSVTGMTEGPQLGPPDCDMDGETDACELNCNAGGCTPGQCGNSADCNGNIIPDECEADCNTNGTPDECDITSGTSEDCDTNGNPDECDGDGDNDGVPDGCDLCPGFDDTADADGDGTPDGCDTCPTSEDVVVENDHFDSNPGWTVVNEAGLTDGAWTWGFPVGGGDRWDPADDFDIGGGCYLTDNVDGNSDVDGGTTRLLSPIYDLSSGSGILTYAYWIGTNSTEPDDTLEVEVSNDGGGNWVSLALYNANEEAWLVEQLDLAMVIGLTDQMRLRFSATDGTPGSVLECGIDAVEIISCVGGCSVDADCDDDNLCTTDTCTGGSCSNTAVDCTGLDTDCADGICNPANGKCEQQFLPSGTTCDDGVNCTTQDTCDGAGTCGGMTLDCSGLDNPCTIGACNESTGTCEPDFLPSGAACDDGSACTSADQCDGAGNCGGKEVICDNNDPCLVFTCNDANGNCESTPARAGTACNDGNLCTVNDACDGAGTCGGSPVDCTGLDNDCTTGVCDPADGSCNPVFANAGTSCDDANACTESDACDGAGNCAGNGVDCSDLNDQCNTGVCDPADGQCLAQPDNVGAACSDDDPCTTSDVCSDKGQCVGTAVDCSGDRDQCNTATCNGTTGDCDITPVVDGTACEDGDDCTTNDTCQSGTCEGGLPNACVAPEPATADGMFKNRYLSFVAGNGPGGEPVVQALRIECLEHPGFSKWVDTPDDNGMARLTCVPVYRDWGSQMIHVGDTDVAPNLTYYVQGIQESADTGDEAAYAKAALLPTSPVWGDITGGFDKIDGWLPPDGNPNFIDIQATIRGFQGDALAPPVPMADLGGEQPNQLINLEDALLAVQGFQQIPYIYPNPQPCP
ncbi:MAG: hypothetical protein ACYTHJ_19195 [Planctomycetota bacterium]|jgi:hypothetical protein